MEGRVLFVINSLEGGGAERVFATVVNNLALARPVEVALLDSTPDKYPIEPSITVTRLGAGGGLAASVRALSALVGQRRPRLIFSFLTRSNWAAVLVGRRYGIPVVISERVNTSSHFGPDLKGRSSRLLVRALYPWAHRIVAVSEGVKTDLVCNYGARADRVDVIHNPVDVDRIRSAGSATPTIDLPPRFAVGVGRLVPNKDFATLVHAFSRVEPGLDLLILGEGPERSALAALSAELGVRSRVHLPGFVDNPYAVVARAEMFVSTSRAEGFPNALVEALTLGVPAVCTDCESGPSEILGGDHSRKSVGLEECAHGMLVPVGSVEHMADGVNRMAAEPTRRRFAAAALERAAGFGVSRTVAAYSSVIDRTLTAR